MTRLDLSGLERIPGATQALEQVWSALPQARLVGGVVRDLLAGVAVSDLDLATPEPPETVMRRLRGSAIRAIGTGLAHGTVTALAAGVPIEITTLRRDEQTDGRRAVVAWTQDWREDARRRDFTINAMSLARDGTLFDYFDGRADLAAGRVRFVGDAGRRIAEDRLRILRFFRFQARYGGADPDPAALAAIAGGLDGLDRLSAERIWSELRRILAGPALAAISALMAEVFDRLLPGGASPSRLGRLLGFGLPADPVLRLAALLQGPAGAVAVRLRLSNVEADFLQSLFMLPAPRPELDDADLRRLLVDTPAPVLCGRSWLEQARSSPGEAAWRKLRERLQAMPRPVFPLSGRDVVGQGVAPGPEVGRLLALVCDRWRADGCIGDRAACLGQLLAILSQGPAAC